MKQKQLGIKTKIKSFSQLGFVLQNELTTQLKGMCPFCFKDEHFYINKENLAWDCKSGGCGKYGNYRSFINRIIEKGVNNFKGKIAVDLSINKGFPVSVLKEWKVGYLPDKNIYILPTGELLQYFRLGKKLMNLSGSGVIIDGIEELMDKRGQVWICEGKWDKIALNELIRDQKGYEKDVIISIPGTNIFKGEWIDFFTERKVNVLYDKGEAGNQGGLKVYNNIRSVVKNIKFLHWESNLPDGYDIRDIYNDDFDINFIEENLNDYPQDVDTTLLEDSKSKHHFTGKGLDFKEVYKKFSKRKGKDKGWLYMENEQVLDVLFGTIIANKLEGDPIWLFLVSPPGGLKTELVRALSESPIIHTESKLTANLLISGFRANGFDPSLVPRLNNRVLIVKDFTTTLTGNQMMKEDTFSILRDIFDGECKRSYGHGVSGVYKSTFGLIACVTPVVEEHADVQSSLGERFLRYYIPISKTVKGRKKYVNAAIRNSGKESKMREELKEIANKVLDYDFDFCPEITEEMELKTVYLSQFLSLMRGTVTRDRFSKEVTHYSYSEIGTRPAKQLIKIMRGVSMFRWEREYITDNSYNIAKYCVNSSISRVLNQIVKTIHRGEKEKYSAQDITERIKLPRITCLRNLENLYMLGVLQKQDMKIGESKVMWGINPDVIELIHESEVYE